MFGFLLYFRRWAVEKPAKNPASQHSNKNDATVMTSGTVMGKGGSDHYAFLHSVDAQNGCIGDIYY